MELKPQDYQYGVMMDAGSSGTRSVFKIEKLQINFTHGFTVTLYVFLYCCVKLIVLLIGT